MLSQEQKNAIAKNREDALKKKSLNEALNAINPDKFTYEENITPENYDLLMNSIEFKNPIKSHSFSSSVDLCKECGQGLADIKYIEAFNEFVCGNCKLKKEEYELVNKTELSSEYLLTDSSIKMMKFLMKDNPKNPHWSQMKLYLKKHAIEKSISRWGSFEIMLAEKDRRKKESFSRELSKSKNDNDTSNLVDESDKVLKNMLNKMKEESGLFSMIDKKDFNSKQAPAVSSSTSRNHNQDDIELINDGSSSLTKKRNVSKLKNTSRDVKRRMQANKLAAIIRGEK